MGKHRIIKNGDVYCHLKVIENLGIKQKHGRNMTFYLCECLKCGKKIEVPVSYLGKIAKDCGCGKHEPRKKIDIGSKFNHLEVLGLGKYVEGRGYYYVCKCDCPKQTVLEVRSDMLTNGDVMSCGCVHDELFEKNSKKAHEKNFVKSTNVPKIAYNTLQKNNTSGYRGVYWHRGISKWGAQIMFQGKHYSLGYYSDIKQAVIARKQAEEELHRDFWEWYKKKFPKEYERIERKRRTTSQ